MRTDLGAGRDENLHLGVRADHGSDVAPVKDRAAIAPCEIALKPHQRLAHLGDCRDPGGGGPGLQTAQVLARKIRLCQTAGRSHRVAALGTDGTVKQPGIEMRKAEMPGQRLADRALARRRRPVQCDRELHPCPLRPIEPCSHEDLPQDGAARNP